MRRGRKPDGMHAATGVLLQATITSLALLPSSTCAASSEASISSVHGKPARGNMELGHHLSYAHRYDM